MPQPFSQKSVLFIKVIFLGAVVLSVAIVMVIKWRMSPAYEKFAPPPQPIQFSHKHHAGDDGIDCRYCHTSVEKSSFAGLPSTQICLTCHSQLFLDSPALAPVHESARTNISIHWTRVHNLPDFVYFDHSIHVNKGVACVECHGRVDQMPLTWRNEALEMQWCLGCHRDASHHVRPLSEEFAMTDLKPLSQQEIEQINRLYHLQSVQRMTDCSTCHR
jgi:hypothetical protein